MAQYMEKLIKKLDEIFEKYGVEQAEIEEVGAIISELGGELKQEGEDFEAPEMGESDGEEDEYDEYED